MSHLFIATYVNFCIGLNLFAIWKLHFPKVDFYLVEKLQLQILLNMTNYKGLLTKELQALYPGFTDIELNEMANCLIDFYTTLTEAAIENNEENKEL